MRYIEVKMSKQANSSGHTKYFELSMKRLT